MAYIERMVIGVIVLITAYSLLEGAQHRQHFHNTITQLLSTSHPIQPASNSPIATPASKASESDSQPSCSQQALL